MSKRSSKAHYRTVKGVGRRCVQVLKNGKWRFKPDSACGGRRHKRRK